MSEKYTSIEAIYSRSHDTGIKNVGVICPKCGIGHRFGDISITGRYNMPPETFFDVKDRLLSPKLDAILPINPETYNLMGFTTVISCYDCKSKMLMVPNHLEEAMEAFNSWRMFTCGTYFLDDVDPEKRYVKRRIYFSDVNFLLTAIMDRVEFENIELNAVDYGGVCAKGVPLIWEFDISYSKDQSFKMLNDLQIVREKDGHRGYIAFSDTFEWNIHAVNADPNAGVEATKRFLEALGVIIDFIHDWCEDHNEETFKDRTTDPFREFYRKAHWDLLNSNATQQDSFKWFMELNPYDYPSMS